MTQRRRRRHSAVCQRHPTSKPTPGFCATCLRERLSAIEALSSDQPPELLRTRSAADFDQPRRRSCDVDDDEEEDERLESSIRIPMVPEEEGEKKTMKELIDLESRTHLAKKNDVASVFTRTFKKLSLKQHPKNGQNGDVYSNRRSCDVDPRLSIESGRISFEEPRASWDGCLIGKTYPKLIPLSSVTEDAKAKTDEEEEEKKPGGTAQTRDYYLDSRRRRSFDRSSRHGLLEVDELKAKLSPEGLFHGAKLLVTERELRDSNWYSIKPEKLELASKGVGCVAGGEVNQDGFGLKKSGKKWGKGWNFWGLIQRKPKSNEVKTEQSLKLGGNAMEGSLAESLLKLRRVAKGEDVSEKLMRSYSVSAARKSCDGGMFRGGSVVNGFEGGRSSCDGLFHGSITGGVETGRRSLCEDKQNHTYSPDSLKNGMVRFYLTPLKSHVTSNSGKSRLVN